MATKESAGTLLILGRQKYTMATTRRMNHGAIDNLHNGRDKDGRPKTLKKHVGDGLEGTVRDKEDGESVAKLPFRHGDVLGEVGNLGISNVGAIKEADEIEEAEL